MTVPSPPSSSGPGPSGPVPADNPSTPGPSASGTSPPPRVILTVADVHVHFGPARAVDGVTLRVNAGEVLALVGESGSGKTTLVRAVQGLQPLTSGTVSMAEPGSAQMVFQDPTGALNPRHTISDIVAEGLRIRGRRVRSSRTESRAESRAETPRTESRAEKGRAANGEREAVQSALARAGLRPPERFLDLYPHEISGGQRQRVVIAGAMVMKPKLLLADEPVASLDASIRGEILALMRSLVDERGLSIIAVTHDLGLAWNIADRIAVMYLGRIVELGDTEEVFAHPHHPYTAALLSVVPEIGHGTPQILVGETPDPRRIPDGCRFRPRCPVYTSGQAAERGVSDLCEKSDPTLVDLNTNTPTSRPQQVACHAAGLD